MTKLPWVSDEQIAEQFHFEGEIPEIILAVGPMRSGSTSLVRLMAEQGIQTCYQPMKGILRNIKHEEETRFTIPAGIEKLFIKETLGSASKNEARFNPIQVLTKAGVPAEKIKLVTILRDPLTSAASVSERCSFLLGRFDDLNTKSDLMDVFISAYDNTDKIQDFAESLGIETTSYIYEACRDNDIESVFSSLFSKLGLDFDPTKFVWDATDSLDDFAIHIDEPQVYYDGSNYFEAVTQSRTMHYSDSTEKRVHEILTPEQAQQIDDAGIEDIYTQFSAKCQKDLDVAINDKKKVKASSINASSLNLLVVNDDAELSILETLANNTNAMVIPWDVCRKALEESTLDRDVDSEILDSGTDLLISVFAEHFLKLGHSVVVNNVTLDDTHNTVWERIKGKTGANLHFIQDTSGIESNGQPSVKAQQDLKMAIVCGPPGTGKTTITDALARNLNMVAFYKDLTELSIKAAIQDPVPTDQVIRSSAYSFMSVLAEYYLGVGKSVIMDGVAPKKAMRDMWKGVATKAQATTYSIETFCSNDVMHKQRLEARVRGMQIQDLSGLTYKWHEVSYDRYLKLRDMFESVRGNVLRLDAANDLEDNVSTAVNLIKGEDPSL